MDTRSLGQFGEEQAARYLRRRFYHMVKLRRDASHGEAREFVTARKQERLRAAAELWLSQHETPLQPRFDVVEVYAPRGEDGPVQIRHIENAFM